MKKVVLAAMTAAVGLCAAANAELIIGATQQGTLVQFDSADPGNILSGVPITGLAQNEFIRGLDIRPATGQTFGLGSFGNLYTLNTANGTATLVGMITPSINGAAFGFDFNPVVDRLRVVSDTQQNLRINPASAAAIVDTPLAYAAGDPRFGIDPNVVHAAYTNSFAGATSTTLYVIDTGEDILAIQNPANNGTLTSVGPLGADVNVIGGFDISGVTGTAYLGVQAQAPNRTTFFTINLATGAATSLGEVGGGLTLTGMAVIPSPGAGALLAIAGVLAFRRER
ncbi:MAG TPA: DUF4394 domain-containing protein [Phycisphaerales bacterium]|nr:DUF4394 domain-containing protein [Phycisphaerales bacterium]